MEIEEFESLLDANRTAVERFVRFRLRSQADADDVLQDVYLTAWRKFPQLRNKDAFKAWILSVARNKCTDYFRKKASLLEFPADTSAERVLSDGRHGVTETYAVRETLRLLGEQDRQLLYLYFWRELPQAESAARLGIPVGTVKSRLHAAKRRFRAQYPYPYRAERTKGESSMKKMPERLPDYQIEAVDAAPFSVKWEELMGWFLIPRLGERLTWGMYDLPSRRCSRVFEMQTTGRARVHGIEGVEVTARESVCGGRETVERRFVAQLTDTHCRYLAAFRDDGEVRDYVTFLDGDAFLPNWGFGEDNIGNETNLAPKGDIRRAGSVVTGGVCDFLLDIVGRYTVAIGGKRYDTVCVMDVETYNNGVVSEQFLDSSGRTVLWRRFNRDDWALDRFGKPWSEQLPQNERLTVNGRTYVHWYDCIADYIL